MIWILSPVIILYCLSLTFPPYVSLLFPISGLQPALIPFDNLLCFYQL